METDIKQIYENKQAYDAAIKSKTLGKFMEKRGARLCPFRLDAEQRSVTSFEDVWSKYGCLKDVCTAWAHNRCQAIYRS
jgi:hypothetical protein